MKAATKPEKPYPDFPLFPHASGRWCKKVRGRFHYFGKWTIGEDPMVALQRWKDAEEDLRAGRVPRVRGAGLTVADLCNKYLNTKKRLLDNGELVFKTFDGYRRDCTKLVSFLGKNRLVADVAADDFDGLRAELAKNLGPQALGMAIKRIRGICKYAHDQGLISQPVRYGQSFNRPSRRVLAVDRNEKGPKMFTAEEIKTLLEAASVTMKAMILLGANCGFGPSDLAKLPLSAVDLKSGWVDFPRPKTGIHRRCPLWRETVTAVRKYLKVRATPQKGNEDLLFLTPRGCRFVNAQGVSVIVNQFRRLTRDVGAYKAGKGFFYTLRHVFETIGGDSRDQVAVDAIMGNTRNDMASVYREGISDERLQAVVAHVRRWLFASEKK